ncbi:MAG: metallophosphoesterase [Chlamydiae bacterium]|nr:metallophosphoesterase [Chlamydiota bacterium]
MTDIFSRSNQFRLAHISDLHFSKLTLNPIHFTSKRWIGNFNLLFRRMREFQHDKIFELIQLFKNLAVDYVVISGDLSTTSRHQEFKKAYQFISLLQEAGLKVIALPGNHDHYTNKDYQKQIFYDHFRSKFDNISPSFLNYNLKDDKLAAVKLGASYWIIALDTTLSTPLLSCNGLFSEKIEASLQKALEEIPKSDKILIANHFPLFTSDQKRKHLDRDSALRNLLQKFPNILFYLHGHTHRHSISDLRKAGLPIILDSGCTAHEKKGSWNLLEFSDNHCNISSYSWKPHNSSSSHWTIAKQNHFELL